MSTPRPLDCDPATYVAAMVSAIRDAGASPQTEPVTVALLSGAGFTAAEITENIDAVMRELRPKLRIAS